MVKTFQVYLGAHGHNSSRSASSNSSCSNSSEDDRTYSCVHCRAHLARHQDLISKSFQGSQGRAYLFEMVVNVSCGKPEERLLLTDISSSCCPAHVIPIRVTWEIMTKPEYRSSGLFCIMDGSNGGDSKGNLRLTLLSNLIRSTLKHHISNDEQSKSSDDMECANFLTSFWISSFHTSQE
ncbi:hypothetical protein CRM22_010556 [Opisthorchis felineus]|nr:hypothetical protein CRM22_010556 [Opisthorchis felineus]